MRKLATVLGTIVLLLGIAPAAQAATRTVTLEIPQTGYFQEGVIASMDVPEALVGAECDVTAEADNNESVRPGTDLTVHSNGSEVVLEDVEREAGAVTIVAAGILTLGPEITVSVAFGPDPAFSGGMTVIADCTVDEPNPPPTTPPPPPEPVNHPKASIEPPTCDDHSFAVTLDNESSDEAQTFNIQLNGLKANSITVAAGETQKFTRHATDGDRLQVFVDTQLAEADANLGRVCEEKDKPKHRPHIGTAIHGRSDRHSTPKNTAYTGFNDNQRKLLGAFVALLFVGGLSLIASRKRRVN